jgi:hypothetical protein
MGRFYFWDGWQRDASAFKWLPISSAFQPSDEAPLAGRSHAGRAASGRSYDAEICPTQVVSTLPPTN